MGGSTDIDTVVVDGRVLVEGGHVTHVSESAVRERFIDAARQIAERVFHVDRLQAIATDLLLLAGLESTPATARKNVDLADLTRSELDRRADPIPIRTNLQNGVTVDGTPVQLARLLTNLLDNAQRHAGERVEVEVSRHNGQALLAVSDDGPGVPEPDRQRIFERFTRLDTARSRHHGGTGLGLAIARDIAHAHSGTITVRDSTQGGACFEVRLPLSADPPVG
ncbi:ATP-binding protein [Nonomuraea sp. NPDC050153]|uniref:sensor histidine kinase n=1 Tax=Nonomuraea sp. NPDC050153 TaxID=3364359 RepID=UPI0037A94340